MCFTRQSNLIDVLGSASLIPLCHSTKNKNSSTALAKSACTVTGRGEASGVGQVTYAANRGTQISCFAGCLFWEFLVSFRSPTILAAR